MTNTKDMMSKHWDHSLFRAVCLILTFVLGGVLRADVTDVDGLTLQVQPAVAPQAKPFALQDVRLLPGLFKTGQDIAVAYLLSLDPDRFLSNFRKEAGLPPKTAHYPGWELRGVSGHSGGHYLSACAIAYAATGDSRFRDRVRYMVQELAECQQAEGDGFIHPRPQPGAILVIFGDVGGV